MEHESIFRALADPSRRRLLDLLFERDGRTLTELESELPMTRFGVMKHLRVLEEVGLITTRKVGSERLHYLNPVPIQLISDRWINKYSAARASALADLKTVLEGGNVMTTDSKPRLVHHIIIKAPQERVWEAITTPEFTARYYYDCTLKTDLTVGSPFTYHKPSGAPIVEGEVVSSDPPNRLVHTYHSLWPPMNKDAPTKVTWELESMPGGHEGHSRPRGLPGRYCDLPGLAERRLDVDPQQHEDVPGDRRADASRVLTYFCIGYCFPGKLVDLLARIS